MRLNKLYFIWICPEMKSFEWFTGLLKRNEEQLAAIGETNLIEARVYLSRGWDEQMARKIMMKEMLAEQRGTSFDPVTGLREPTYYG